MLELPFYCRVEKKHGLFVPPLHLPASVHERLTELESKLIEFWGSNTTVTWTSPGGGGGGGRFPDQQSLRWDGSLSCVKQMARIDFMRGVAADDQPNVVWGSWARGMPNLLNSVRMAGDAAARPQWMEAMVGVCYHAAEGGRQLSLYQSDLAIWPHSKSKIAIDIWFLLEEMGLRASNRAPIVDRRLMAPPPPPLAKKVRFDVIELVDAVSSASVSTVQLLEPTPVPNVDTFLSPFLSPFLTRYPSVAAAIQELSETVEIADAIEEPSETVETADEIEEPSATQRPPLSEKPDWLPEVWFRRN